MTIQSYKKGKRLPFTENEITPIHLAEAQERHYYVFADGENIPAGGREVKEEELPMIVQNSQLIRQIKQEAYLRILSLAPLWKQQNALVDITLLRQQETLDEEQRKRLQEAEHLLERIQAIRLRSNEIEASFLQGIAIDYLTDRGWDSLDRDSLERDSLGGDGEENAQ